MNQKVYSQHSVQSEGHYSVAGILEELIEKGNTIIHFMQDSFGSLIVLYAEPKTKPES